jgi:hypothetical protein
MDVARVFPLQVYKSTFLQPDLVTDVAHDSNDRLHCLDSTRTNKKAKDYEVRVHHNVWQLLDQSVWEDIVQRHDLG